MNNPSSQQQWEYNYRLMPAKWDQGPAYAVEAMMEEADKVGQDGWEMVNFSVVNEYSNGVGEALRGQTGALQQLTRMQHKMWIVLAMFKRPVV
jgi:hypothetical protein